MFEISADPSKAQDALDRFEKSTGKSFAAAAAGTKPLDASLLSNRESVRLLTEEMGVKMPRAVTGAIAEMVPAIGAIGPVLLGAFAVEEIPKMISGIREAANSWEGFGKAEQEAMKKAIQDTATLHTKVLDVEKELELFGKTEAAQAALRAQWASEDADKALKYLVAAEAKVKEINAQIAEAKRGAGVFGAGAGTAFEKSLTAANAQVNELREAWKLADEQALVAQKRAAQAAQETTQAAKAASETVFKIFGTGQQQGTFALAIDGLTKAIDVDVESINLWANSLQGPELIWSEVNRTLDDSNKIIAEGVVQHSLLARALELENKSRLQGVESIAQNAAGLLQELGLKREYAAFMAVYEAAQGFEDLGNWNFWGAAQAFESSVMYAKAAGRGSEKRSAAVGAGAGGSGGSAGGRQPVDRGGSAGGGGGSSAYSQMVVNISGGGLSTLGQQQLAAWVGVGQTIGLFKFQSNGSSGIAAPRY